MVSNKRQLILMALAVVAIGLSLVVSLYHLAYVQKIYPFVSIGPVGVSNLSLKGAEIKLEQVIPDSLGQIKLVFGNRDWPVELNELKIIYDATASAQKAYVRGRSENFFKDLGLKWQQWRQPVTLSLEFSLDEEKFKQAVEAVTLAIEEESIKPALILNGGQVRLVAGRNGRRVELEKLTQTVRQQLGKLDFSSIEIPVQLVKVETSGEELAKAQERAEKLKGSQLVIKYEDFTQKVARQELIDLIGFSAKDGPAFDWDEEKIASLTANLAQSIYRPAQNASFQFDGQKVVEFKPALAGWQVNLEPSRQKIIAGLIKLAAGEEKTIEVELVVETTQPEIQIGDVNDLGIRELLGKGESSFHGSIAGRKHNIALAAIRLNGLVVAPNEVFSFNRAVGDISSVTGYKSAYIIKDGRTILGDGGGVCQVSTTLFRAVLAAGLEILERHPHSYRVSYYEQNSPAGLDATVFAPSVDLKFKNDTENYVLIQAMTDLNSNRLKFELYGSSDGRQATVNNVRLWGQIPPPPALYQDDPTLASGQIKQVDWSAWGARAAFDWQVVRNGEVIHQKTFYSSYQPWQAVFLRGTKI